MPRRSCFRARSTEATESILEALTESGRNVDSFVLDVASVLAYSLAQQGVFMTARVYATLAMMASGYEGGQTAVSVLRQMNSAPIINQLLKSIPTEIRRPADARLGRTVRRSLDAAAQQQSRFGASQNSSRCDERIRTNRPCFRGC